MLLHQLKLNDDKTEFMVLQSSHNLRVHDSPTLQLPQLTLTSTNTARNLGCFFDRHMQLDRLVSSYCSSAYYHLRTINNILHLLTLDVCHAAVRSFVLKAPLHDTNHSHGACQLPRILVNRYLQICIEPNSNRKVWLVARVYRIRDTRVKRSCSSFCFRADSLG